MADPTQRNSKGHFIEGHTKVGGIQKGYRYYPTDLSRYLKSHGIDVRNMLAKALQGEKLPCSESLLWKTLEFCYPKAKPFEAAPPPKEEPENTEELEDFTHLLEEQSGDKDV